MDCQTMTVLSCNPAEAKSEESASGLKAAWAIWPMCPCTVNNNLPSLTSHIFRVPSSEDVKTKLPDWWKVREVMDLE